MYIKERTSFYEGKYYGPLQHTHIHLEEEKKSFSHFHIVRGSSNCKTFDNKRTFVLEETIKKIKMLFGIVLLFASPL